MTTETLTDWLRSELEADWQAAAGKSTAEWCITAVDTVVALGLLARAMIYSCVYAINHAEPDAEIAFSLADPPLEADCWGFVDDLQASLLGAIAVAWVITAHEFGSMPTAWFGFLAINAAVLVVDPVRVVATEVVR